MNPIPFARFACLAPFLVAPLLKAQTTLYVYNSIFETDSLATGTHPSQLGWQISDGSTTTSGGISDFNANGMPSPQGGNYVYGSYQGQNNLPNGIYNFTAVSGAASYADGNANPFTNWQDGQQYEIVYWFRPIEILNTVDGSLWSMTFAADSVFQLIDANGAIFDNGTLPTTISSTGWTELHVPITYSNAVWQGNAPLFFLSPQYNGWTQTGGPAGGFNPVLGNPSALFSVAIDTGVAVPEPGAGLLCGLASFVFLRRRRA